MKLRFFSLMLALMPILLWGQSGHAVDVSYADGQLCRVTFYTPSIVRVEKYAAGVNPDGARQSLVVCMEPDNTPPAVKRKKGQTLVSSSKLTVTIDHLTGHVCFQHQGKTLLKEGHHAVIPISQGADTGCYKVSQTFALEPDEAVYGIGLMENGKLNQRGEDRLMVQSNLEDYQSIFQSIKGYGVFWDNYSPTQLTDHSKEGLTFDSQVGDGVDYYFMYGGSADGVVALIRQLTGDVPMLPMFTYGFWQSRERYKSSSELTDVVDRYRTLGIPLDGIVLDWQYWDSNYLWNAMEFLNPEFSRAQQMIDHVHRQHAKFAISIWQSFGPHTRGYRDMNEKNLLFNFETWPQSGLSAWPPNMDYPSGVKVYKPYTEEARDIYWKHLRRLYDMGVDAWWMDSTDPDHHSYKESDLDEPTALGTYRKVRNAFPLMCVKGVYEHQRKTDTEGRKRVFIYTRSGFAGQQRYGSNVWTGDVGSNWQNLRNQIPMGLSFSLTGNPNFNSDIGGFFSGSYNKGGDPTSGCRNPRFQELYVRWMQFGAFCPMMRSHGTDTYREIYYFGQKGEPVYDALTEAISLRYRLLPYIYSTSWDVTRHRGTFMRALMMDFAADAKVKDMTDEYLFGRSLLVAPVVKAQYTEEKGGWEEGEKASVDFMAPRTTKVYLPRGTAWYAYADGKKYAGGREVPVPTTIKTIPLFVREGSIIPIGPEMQYTSEKKWDELELRLYPGRDASFTLYEDEGDGYGYEDGRYSEIVFHWKERSQTLTIEDCQGVFPGMLQQRSFRLVNVATGEVKTITYDNRKQVVHF